MQTARLIVAALGALPWLAPATDAAGDLQATWCRARSVSPEGAYGAYFRPDHDLAIGERQLDLVVPIYVSLPPDRTGGCVGSMNQLRVRPHQDSPYIHRGSWERWVCHAMGVRAGRIFRDSALNLGTRGCHEATPLSLTRSLNSLLMTGCGTNATCRHVLAPTWMPTRKNMRPRRRRWSSQWADVFLQPDKT